MTDDMTNISGKVVAAILTELKDRKGFNWWWDDLDEDIQVEIKAALEGIVSGLVDD